MAAGGVPWAEQSLAAPATLVSVGLGCFSVVQGAGILHEPHMTGGGASSAKQPSCQAVNTALGHIKTSLSGLYLMASPLASALAASRERHVHLNRRFFGPDNQTVVLREAIHRCSGRPQVFASVPRLSVVAMKPVLLRA